MNSPDSTSPSARATLLIVLPESPDELLNFANALVETTPAELFDVVFIDLGAPPGTVALVNSFGGDVRVASFPNATASDAISELSRSIALPVVLNVAGHDFHAGWLEEMLGQTQNQAPGPDVMNGLGSATTDDIATLLDIAKNGNAYVGQLPMAEAERVRDRLQMEEERRLLEISRNGRDVCWTDEGVDEPLITVRIPTYNKGQVIVDTAINSVLAQTYEHIEVIVVGDHCDEATERAVRSVKDPRLTFINLPARGIYPQDTWLRWLVAGAPPMNTGIERANGAWIAPCDDDEFTPDHVELLLREARSRRLEMVWSKSEMEFERGKWQTVGGEPLGPGNVTHGAVMYSAGLRFMRMSVTCWKMNEPSDGNFWRHMSSIGVRTGFVDHVTYRHYLEGRFRENVQGPQKYE
jgi:hypothetical protein